MKLSINPFAWVSVRDEPARQLTAWASSRMDNLVSSVTAYPAGRVAWWKVYATGNIGGWICYVDTGKVVHPEIPESWITPAVMVEASGIKGSPFAKEWDYWSISTPGYLLEGGDGGFLPVLPPTQGTDGRGWLNAKDLHQPLRFWLSSSTPEQWGLEWIYSILADEIIPLGGTGVAIAREFLRNYLLDWTPNAVSRKELWRLFYSHLIRTQAWKRCERSKRMEILTVVGTSLCHQFPDWDSTESWSHLKVLNERYK